MKSIAITLVLAGVAVAFVFLASQGLGGSGTQQSGGGNQNVDGASSGPLADALGPEGELSRGNAVAQHALSTDDVLLRAGEQPIASDDWWQSLRRESSGWLIHQLPVSTSSLMNPEEYVRSVDLNPRDIPLARSQVKEIDDMVETWRPSIEGLVSKQVNASAKGLNKMVSEGTVKAITVEGLDDDQRSRHRRAVKNALRRQGKLGEKGQSVDKLIQSASDRTKRIAMLNMLGQEYGVVQDAGGGVYYATRVQNIPSASVIERQLSQSLGEYWLAIIGCMAQWGALTDREALELADQCWRRLRLPG
tara:strand:- start:250 stop:1164 length:915 start_codon:yes stop_codon:yes gene_type:complete